MYAASIVACAAARIAGVVPPHCGARLHNKVLAVVVSNKSFQTSKWVFQ
jgi:hypothetical protein